MKNKNRKWRKEHLVVGYGFLLPDAIGLFVFLVIPTLFAFVISFYQWNGLSSAQFIGLENYKNLVDDSYFLKSLGVTVKFVSIFVVLNYLLSLILALFVRKKFRGVSLFRTIFFIPVAMSIVVTSIIWKYIFQPTNGLLNIFLNFLGIKGLDWLGSEQQALYCVIVVTLFMSIGYYMVIFIAGLNEIPAQYYDAARIDGASWWRQFIHITLPLLKPTSFFVILITIISSFQIFDQIYVLTQGGPFYATTSVVYYIYEISFRYLRFGYASSMAFVLFVILFITSVFVIKKMRGGEISD